MDDFKILNYTTEEIDALLKQVEEGGGSADAVLYTAQTLTDAEKTIARNNIGVNATTISETEPTTFIGEGNIWYVV